MNDKFISYEDINRDMQQIEDVGEALAQRLGWLDRIIIYIFSQIKQCESKQSAQKYFDCLDRIQIGLSILVSRDDIGIPYRLHRFMKDFDNFDEAKEHYFEKNTERRNSLDN